MLPCEEVQSNKWSEVNSNLGEVAIQLSYLPALCLHCDQNVIATHYIKYHKCYEYDASDGFMFPN